MSSTPVAELPKPAVVHALPGRLRLHLSGWSGEGRHRLEAHVQALEGVRRVRASPMTGNIVIEYDPGSRRQDDILTAIGGYEQRRLSAAPTPLPSSARSNPYGVQQDRARRGAPRRARISVRGIERDPRLAARVEEQLEQLPGVRASASPLTGRVLVELSDGAELGDVLSEVATLEMPDNPGSPPLAHPLDAGPLVWNTTRAAGGALGLGYLGARRMLGAPEAVDSSNRAAMVAAATGLLQGFPAARSALDDLLGTTATNVILGAVGAASNALSGMFGGLALGAIEGLRATMEATARRNAWRRHEERETAAPKARHGAVIDLETRDRTPLAAVVLDGTGTAVGRDGAPLPIAPGERIPAGATLYGGPFRLRLEGGKAFTPESRPAPPNAAGADRYLRLAGFASLGYAVIRGLLTRSFGRAFESLLLVNPRTVVVGTGAANGAAFERVLRAGATIVGTRPERVIQRPHMLVIDGVRVLTAGFEIDSVLPLRDDTTVGDIIARAATIAGGCDSPWGSLFDHGAGTGAASGGQFDGRTARAVIDGATWMLGPLPLDDHLSAAIRLRGRGAYLLALRQERAAQPAGLIALRPRLGPAVEGLVEVCRRHGVEIGLVHAGENRRAAEAVARRAGVAVVSHPRAIDVIRERQQQGGIVAVVTDCADSAAALAASDLGIGLVDSRTRFAAAADLLIEDLETLVTVVDTGQRHDAAVRDSIGLGVLANVAGAIWGILRRPTIAQASNVVNIAAIGSIVLAWWRMRGGDRPRRVSAEIVDPRPERWGRRGVPDVLHALDTTEQGLTTEAAIARWQPPASTDRHASLLDVILEQVREPLIGLLAVGAGFSLVMGSPVDILLIGTTIAVNVAVGIWQDRQVDRAAAELQRLGAGQARVLRDGETVTIPASEVVPGDVLPLAAGDHVVADARLLSVDGLEVDEAALTGESLPVTKTVATGPDASRIVLEGSDVVSGSGRAVVVAVGDKTRLGATATALNIDTNTPDPLAKRLREMLNLLLPAAVGVGGVATVVGMLRQRSFMQPLTLGTSIAIAAIPEGLPLLAKVGEATVAHRLMGRKALVRRLSAIEALGRVDIACTDKTGTLTEGRLTLRLVTTATGDREAAPDTDLTPALRQVLLGAALASPRPNETPNGDLRPTDAAVVNAARDLGLGTELQGDRMAESFFEPARGFHATHAGEAVYVKGAPEALVPRCDRIRDGGDDRLLNDADRAQLLDRVQHLAARGLRVLMVAEGSADTPTDDPGELIAVGFVGISDPIKPDVPEAIRQCHAAGIRVIMLTGDHPATARSIARDAGLRNGELLTGADIARMDNAELGAALERTSVIARATPLDKLRIVGSLQQYGHTIAMTGDGANDGPALRLAEVGIAMGRGTDVARHAADLVLADDDFATIVQALIEGRTFWRNIRRALGLLLGGNLGELSLLAAPSFAGMPPPLNARQILVVNMITDALPAIAIVLQRPEKRDLHGLAREGETALEGPLRQEIFRRGSITAIPTLAAYLLAHGAGGPSQAATVAFAGMVGTQLAQTLDIGYAGGRMNPAVLASATAAGGLLLATLVFPPIRALLGLAAPTGFGWLLIGASALGAFGMSRFSGPRSLDHWSERAVTAGQQPPRLPDAFPVA